MQQKPIRVITQDFQLLTEIDTYTSLQLSRKWHGIGELEMHINKHMKDVSLLQRGVLLIAGGDLHKVYIIRSKEIELDDNGKASENWTIKAPALKSVLGQRITLPPSDTAYDNKQGDAETVMKHYVTENVTTPIDVDRAIPNIQNAANQNRGDTLSWQSRFKNLAEELQEQSLASGLGWNVSLDLQQQKWVFDVTVGRDLTVNQSTLPPVIFSPEFDSLKTLNYSESELDYKNSAYVAGQGEGTDRRVVELGEQTGMSRHEMFVDARNVDETTGSGQNEKPRPESEIIADLTNQGQRKLDKHIQERFLEAQLLTPVRRTSVSKESYFLMPNQVYEKTTKKTTIRASFIFEEDFDLGDAVTVQSKDWGVTMDARITEIKEIYESSGFQLEATFGSDRPTLIDKIKRGFDETSNEVRK